MKMEIIFQSIGSVSEGFLDFAFPNADDCGWCPPLSILCMRNRLESTGTKKKAKQKKTNNAMWGKISAHYKKDSFFYISISQVNYKELIMKSRSYWN